MVGLDGQLALPWIEPELRRALNSQHAHALLVHGPQGVGQFELALTLAQAWLCESEAVSTMKPCGVCASCRLVQAHSHPDLLVLLPEVLQEALGWNAVGGEDAGIERAGKAKPSKDIKVEAVRSAVTFAQTTSARGRAKVVVLHPAERMNGISANTLLKTLEEPPGVARFVLSCGSPDALLPTIRSRCQSVQLSVPSADLAVEWLSRQDVANAAVMLAATGGQPQEALDWSRQGIDAALWTRLPDLVRRGEAAAIAAWPLPRVLDALQKLCHDAACVAVGAPPRYFAPTAIGRAADVPALNTWMNELNRVAQYAEHPWNAGLMIESLVQQGQRALSATPSERGAQGAAGATQKGSPRQGVSVHSRA
jgi:DNA polymerase-3 subunit delta'